jgi:hypothetical protein
MCAMNDFTPRAMDINTQHIGTAIHRILEKYGHMFQARRDGSTPTFMDAHVHLDFRKTWTLESSGMSPQLYAIMTGRGLSEIRRELRKRRRTPAWQRTHSKRKRAGMRRTRRMMRA